jgi:hypothetical protein
MLAALQARRDCWMKDSVIARLMTRHALAAAVVCGTALAASGGCGNDDDSESQSPASGGNGGSGGSAGGPTTTGDAGAAGAPTHSGAEISARDGGMVDSDDGRLTLFIPPDALDEDTVIEITPLSRTERSPAWDDWGVPTTATYRLQPDGLVFNDAVAIAIRVAEEELPGVDDPPATGAEPVYGIASQSDGALPEVWLGGVVSGSSPNGTLEVLGLLEHFSEVSVGNYGTLQLTTECTTCEVGPTFLGSVMFEPNENFDALVQTMSLPSAHGCPPVNVEVTDQTRHSREFDYSCASASETACIASALNARGEEAETPEDLFLSYLHFFTGQREVEATAHLRQNIVCTAEECSIDNGDQCARADDCSVNQSCSDGCQCVCVAGENGAACSKDDDCDGGVCSQNCECEPEETCENISVETQALAEALGIDLATAVCLLTRTQQITHSSVDGGTQPVAGDHTTLQLALLQGVILKIASVNALVDPLDALVLTPSPSSEVPADDETSLVILNRMDGPIPDGDPTKRYQYGFVFDADGDASNNYQAPPEYPNDFFDGTDRWYTADYDPSTGWSVTVRTAIDGQITTAASQARVVMTGRSIALIVPKSEFSGAEPMGRFSAFCHTGDWGAASPWDGSLWPAVESGLGTLW